MGVHFVTRGVAATHRVTLRTYAVPNVTRQLARGRRVTKRTPASLPSAVEILRIRYGCRA